MGLFYQFPRGVLVAIFLSAGVFALVFPILPAKLFFLLVSVIALLNWKSLVKGLVQPPIKNILLLSGLFLMALMFAIFNSVSLISQKSIGDVIFQFVSIIANILMLLLVVYYASDKRFIYILYFSFFIPFFLAPFIFFWDRMNFYPAFKHIYNFGSMGGGPTYYFVTLLIVPMVALFWLLLVKKHYFIKVVSLAGLVFLFALSLWSGSRATWLALIVAFLFLGFKILKFEGNLWFKARQVLLILLLLNVIGIGGFMILPCGAKLFVLGRISNRALTTYTNYIWGVPNQFLCRNLVMGEILHLTTLRDINIFISQNRLDLWRQAAAYSLGNQLGYGPFYSQVIDIQEGDRNYVPAHNIFFESFLSGGFIAFAIIIFLFYWSLSFIFKQTSDYYKSSILTAINPALLAVFVRFFFNDVLFSRWLWLVVALFIAFRFYSERQNLVVK